MNLEGFSDEELVARARGAAGSPPAVEFIDELFRRHYGRVARWCFRFTGDRESAADLAQEIFAKVYRCLDSFQGQSKFSTWLHSVAKNECLNAVRLRPIWPGGAGGEMLDQGADQDESDFGFAAERLTWAHLARQLLNEALDETEKTVFALHFGEDLPLEAITRLLGLRNASGAKAYIVSARRKISRLIQRWKAQEQRTMGEGREP
jgi:RNA polymerase sigma-70 factor (ECF subfamily)